MAIVITLLHPSKSAPVQSWVFESETEITLGRGSQNDVVLYSAVVSRRHAKIQQIAERDFSRDDDSRDDSHWELVNFGANGTYVDDSVLTKERESIPVYNGTVVRLGETGPKICIRLGAVDPNSLGKVVRRRSLDSVNVNPPEQKTRSTFLRAKADSKPPDSTTNVE